MRTRWYPGSRSRWKAVWPRGMRLFGNRVPSSACDSDEGITALEYALLGSLIALALIGGATAFGEELGDAYDNIGQTVDDIFD